MPTMRTLLFTFFVYTSFTAALTDAAYFGVRSLREDSTGVEDVDNTVNQNGDQTSFSRLLSVVSPRALHQLLHEYAPNAFKDGVSGSDHQTVEAVHARSPELPSSVVRLAIRQGTSANNTTTSDTTTSSSAPATTSDTPSTTSTDEPTTSTEQTPTETTSTNQDTPTASSSTPATTPTPTPTSTPTSPSSSTSTSTSTSSSTPTTEATETETPDSTSSSSWQTSKSSSDAHSSTTSTFSTSTTPTPTSRTSTFTSTLPGGAVTTVTEVAVVTPGVTDGDSTPTSAIGNLQTGSAAPIVRRPGFEIFAGFLVGGVIFA
ncbi:hypothetical protein F4823DRAFT_587145 [Ustulina deusta]|nr:hypothetical protein F4823DRAFT_587145 [Ustulina deusta]